MPKTAEERFSDLTNRYLIGTGLAAIFIVAKVGEPARLELATDVVAVVRKLEAQDGVVFLARFWFSNARVATAVFERSADATGDQFSLAERVHEAATALEVDLKDDQLVAAQCASAVAEIEQVTEDARLTGQLKSLNAAYKAHRQQTGDGAVPYEEFLHLHKAKAVEAAAARVRSVLRTATH
jgi:hypothetical protein